MMVPKATASALATILLLTACGGAVKAPVGSGNPEPPAAKTEAPALFYHIFIRSFADSNGDRHGDLRGIIARLDYLKSLGVTGILLTPLYPSQFYHNYFADDFYGVDAEFGTMDDYAAFIREAKARGIQIYLDQEIQYVAGQHKWYADALGNPASEWDGYALFSDEGNTEPVGTLFGRTEFQVWPRQDQTIVTVDLLKPEVREYFTDYLKFWMDPNGDGDFSDGVDGFRIDHMMDDLDNAGVLTGLFGDFWIPVFSNLRAVNPEIVIVAEQADWGYGRTFLEDGRTDMVFGFPIWSAARDLDATRFAEAVRVTNTAIGPDKGQFLFIESHDTDRFAGKGRNKVPVLKLGAAVNLLTGWTPIMFYGQEIGMTGDRMEGELSPALARSGDDVRDIPIRQAMRWQGDPSSDGMATWYTLDPEAYPVADTNQPGDGVSVTEQGGDPDSLLNAYRALSTVRVANPALALGSTEVLSQQGDAVLLVRRSQEQTAFVAFNFGERETPIEWTSTSELARVYGAADVETFDGQVSATLNPFEAAVWVSLNPAGRLPSRHRTPADHPR